MARRRKSQIGSIPVMVCHELVNGNEKGESSKRSWIFECQHCGVWHSHRAGERHVGNVCFSDHGRQANKYGYVIRLRGG